MYNSPQQTCCFIGHRKINENEQLKEELCSIIENLILNHNVDTFLFGSKSRFNSFCHEQVTKLKYKYPHIKRIYVRAEFLYIDQSYEDYLLEDYEETFYSKNAIGANKAVYTQRNFDMINQSDFCIFYYTEDCLPTNRKSGTKLALDYATKKNKNIFILP